jgi:glycosyltransferase involved in cell wall biosynthesis
MMQDKSKSRLISIIIPVYNGAQSIGRLVDTLIAELTKDYSIEIVLVNDCSPDDSEKICLQVQQKHAAHVRFFSLAKNVGEHNAVMAGLNQCKGDYAVIMDDDFQNPIHAVITLIQTVLQNDHDVVYTYYETKHHPWFRNLGSKFNDAVANVMLQKPKDLYLSSFKAINRFLINEIIRYQLPFPYIDGLILRTTTSIGKVQVEHNPRESGKSGYTFKKLVSLWSNMFVNFSILPLRISVILGFIFSLLGLSLGIYTVIEKILYPEIPVGYSALIVTVAVFSGVQLIAMGMIGEYLGRMFLSQNKKPQFTIRRSYE